jgi:hypothetical protein
MRRYSVTSCFMQHSMHNLSSSRLLSQNEKVETHGTIILPAMGVKRLLSAAMEGGGGGLGLEAEG